MSRQSRHMRPETRPVLVRLTLLIAGLILRCYPNKFRRRFGDAALAHASELARATFERRGALGLVALWPRLFWDLLPHAAEPTPSSPPPPRRKSASMFDNVLNDLRFARRSMARSPGNTLLAVLIIAIGVGSSVSMFSVIDAVMLRPLPYPDSERITSLQVTIPSWQENPTLAPFWDQARWEYEEFESWRASQTSFEHAGSIGLVSANLTGAGPAERVRVGLAGVGLFEVFGATPQIGRLFSPEDEVETRIAIVSDAFWRTKLEGDDNVLGRTFTIDSVAYSVVGVLPPGFEISRFNADLWIPIFSGQPGGYFPGNTGDMGHTLQAMGLLEEGVTPRLAEEELVGILTSLADESHFAEHGGRVVPRLEFETRGVRAPMMLLMGAVLLLLVVACANVATLLLGQAIDRRQEMAVRSAIGAGRSRVVRQLLTESFALGAAAGIVGLAFAVVGIRGVAALAPQSLPRLDTVALDVRAAAFAIGVSVLAGLLFGLAPALTVGRNDISKTLRTARSGSAAKSRMQAGMIVAEIALATVLLVAAGLLTRSFVRLNAVEPGFDARGLLMLRLSIDMSLYRLDDGALDDGAVRSHVDGIAEAINALPGVEGAAAGHPPFSGSGANNGIVPADYVPQEGEFFLGHRRFVHPGFLELMGMTLVEGRLIDARDHHADAASSVVVTETVARRFWPDGAVGEKLTWWNQDSTVVGVVGDVLHESLDKEAEMMFFASSAKFRQGSGFLVVRTAGDARDFVEPVREAVRRAAPNTPLSILQPVEERIARTIDQQRFRTRLIGLFAVVSAVLSVLGLYGVTSRAVAGRARELGVRVALGANKANVMRLVLGDGVRLAAIGAVVGIGASIAGTDLLASYLYDVEPNDPLTLAAIVALVAGMAILASLIPSLRASNVNPVEVLGREG